MRDFRKLRIWKDSLDLATEIYPITIILPKEEKYGLVSQIRRSAISIPSNIAEGCRGTNKEMNHFLQIAMGSSFELETQILLIVKLNMVKPNNVNETLAKLQLLQKRISAFRNSIREKLN